MLRNAMAAVSAMTLAVAGIVQADVWDVQTVNDNTPASQNELVHGSDQMHDLGALPGLVADQDWFRLSQQPYSSYEVVVDATSGDLGTVTLARTDEAGTTTVQSSAPIGVGFSRSLRWSNDTANTVNSQRIVVTSPGCTTCGTDDVYRVRFYETTYSVPRFNNSGTQVTVLIVQNPTNYRISGTVRFWSAAGALIASSPFNLAAKNTLVLSTQTIAPGVSGAITITHDGRYGDLAGKAVALEPATGFSFDSPLVPRIH